MPEWLVLLDVSRRLCEHEDGGAEASHCTSAPELLDVWRTALYLAYLHDPVVGTNRQLRVVGVDGTVGPLVEPAIDTLCDTGWYAGFACTGVSRRIAYEVTNQGYGWFYFHHHHMHISTQGLIEGSPMVVKNPCMAAGCAHVDPQTDPRRFYLTGRARYEAPRTLELVGPAN